MLSRNKQTNELTLFLCARLKLKELVVCLVQVTKIGRSLVGELFVIALRLILLVLFLLLALEEISDAWEVLRATEVPDVDVSISSEGVAQTDYALVAFRPWDFFAVVVHHGDISPVVRTAQSNDLVLPMPLLPHQPVDVIVQVSDLIVS